MASDEAALSSINSHISEINKKLEKFENNHFRHIEPDVAFLKDFAVRSEKVLIDISQELRQNTKDTQDLKVDMAVKVGEINTKVASLEGRGESNTDWVKNIVMMIVSLLIGAAITFMTR